MDLTTGYPYWLINSGLPFNYPKLRSPVKTEVVIVGGGISGALTAYTLTMAGISCVLIDARTIGLGSTCASTSLLQYELDKPLHELSSIIGFKNAMRTYKLCSRAIDKLQHIAQKLQFNGFQCQHSLYYSAGKTDIKKLETEFLYRQVAGFDVSLLQKKDVEQYYGFSADVGILSSKGAVTNAYMFTHYLLQAALKEGLQVFDRTRAVKIQYSKKNLTVVTTEGHTIHARKMINASGYEITEFINKKIVSLSSTYAFASEHIDTDMDFLKKNTMLWNTANPYLYMRTTLDKRIMVGGRDEDFYDPVKRDKLIKVKSRLLAGDFRKLFPGSKIVPEFSWTGTFGSTKDSLPYIGTYTKTPHTYYALGFGGNGITFSLIAAEIIRDLILEKKNTDADLFSFNR